jgi:hypothetical protein
VGVKKLNNSCYLTYGECGGAHLQKELHKLKKKNKRDQKARSFATLPDELLAEVFRHCVEGDTGKKGGEELGFSPRNLALISRRWYRVALATGSLWHTILVTDTASFYWKLKQNSALPVEARIDRVFTLLNRSVVSALEGLHMTSTLRKRFKEGPESAALFPATWTLSACPHSGSAPSAFVLSASPFQDIRTFYPNSNISERLLAQALSFFFALRELRLAPGNKIAQS